MAEHHSPDPVLSQVLLILVVGLWLATRVAVVGQRFVLGRFAGREGTMLLVLRGIDLAAVVGLVVFALTTVHSPLTAFAFLGGALAIGAGFGAQNILNSDPYSSCRAVFGVPELGL